MGKVFFISDLHFGHKNVVAFDSAPFADIESYNAGVIARWNEVVGDEDTVYVLGDLAICKKYNRIAAWVSQLRGRKILVMGNHDYLKVEEYYKMGFVRVYDHPVLLRGRFILSHAPLNVPAGMPYYNIFGHVHVLPNFETETENTYCVCACRHDWRPVEVAAWNSYDASQNNTLRSFE